MPSVYREVTWDDPRDRMLIHFRKPEEGETLQQYYAILKLAFDQEYALRSLRQDWCRIVGRPDRSGLDDIAVCRFKENVSPQALSSRKWRLDQVDVLHQRPSVKEAPRERPVTTPGMG